MEVRKEQSILQFTIVESRMWVSRRRKIRVNNRGCRVIFVINNYISFVVTSRVLLRVVLGRLLPSDHQARIMSMKYQFKNC